MSTVPTTLIFATDLPAEITPDMLQKVFSSVLKAVDWRLKGTISLAFTNKADSRRINKQFAGNDYATDVLSFVYKKDILRTEDEIIGEIAICTPIAIEQAHQYGSNISSEVALLLTHGLLHMNGADHQTKSEQASFEDIQSAIMKSLKLIYHTMPW